MCSNVVGVALDEGGLSPRLLSLASDARLLSAAASALTIFCTSSLTTKERNMIIEITQRWGSANRLDTIAFPCGAIYQPIMPKTCATCENNPVEFSKRRTLPASNTDNVRRSTKNSCQDCLTSSQMVFNTDDGLTHWDQGHNATSCEAVHDLLSWSLHVNHYSSSKRSSRRMPCGDWACDWTCRFLFV